MVFFIDLLYIRQEVGLAAADVFDIAYKSEVRIDTLYVENVFVCCFEVEKI